MSVEILPSEGVPRNIEAEQSLLGAVLLGDVETIEKISDFIGPDDFEEPAHQDIFRVCQAVADDGKPPKPSTVRHFFVGDERLQAVGGDQYIARLVSASAADVEIPHLVEVVRELSIRRRVLDACVEGARAARAERETPALDIAQIVERKFDAARGEPVGGGMIDSATAVSRAIAGMREAQERQGVVGATSGFEKLDRRLGGFRRGEMTVVGARPSMGKSALGLQIAMNAARAGHGVGFVSLEMPAAQLMTRAISAEAFGESPIPYIKALRGELNREMWERWDVAAAAIRALPLYIDDRANLDVFEIRRAARRLARRLERDGRRLDLLVVDHVTIVRDSGRWGNNPVRAVEEISADLAATAKVMDAHVLTLAQLNRSVEGRDDKRPTLADLRWSGGLEQDATAVLLLFRELYYLERSRPSEPHKLQDWQVECDRCRNVLEVIAAKVRNGPVGSDELWADMGSNFIADVRPDFQQGMEL